ncbi:MAG TPA: hypothetical protein V6D15_13825 [Oculatellaceae cyanobacterium]|jgi:Cdc6-like AAA superfamily ATPase
MTATTSSIDNIIRKYNPFAGNTVVRPPQIWGKSFPDVTSINAHASNAVFEAVKQVQQGQRETVGITIRGERGLGKTQIISRIRHGLQSDDSTLFIYMNKYDNLNKIKYQFLQNLVSSLRAFGSSQGIMQLQELASNLINEAKQWNNTPHQYINVFPSWLNKYSTQLVDHLTDCIIQIKPNIQNPYLVRAVLWTLSSSHTVYATHWLSGMELAETQSITMGLPNINRENPESEALTTVCQVLDLASNYKVPVICFDELDTLEADENGLTPAMVVASLTKDLYNNLRRSVLLLAMYEETWDFQVRALPQAEAVIDRIASYPIQGQPIDLKHLNSDDVVAITKEWLENFYQEHKQTPPHNLYPFDETKLRDFGKQKPTVRSLLKWCAENFVPSSAPDPIKPVALCFKTELTNLEDIDILSEENNQAIADALWLAFSTMENQTVEGVTVKAIGKNQAPEQAYIQFKIIGQENGEIVKIGVAVLQQSGGKYQGAALKRLIDYKKFDLTRGCLVRSKKINSSAGVAKECVRKLLQELGGEWVLLQSQDIKPLLAIKAVYDSHESYELTKDSIVEYIKTSQLAINNPLIREILSDPSGQEPNNLIDEDLPISIPKIEVELSDGIELNLVN